MKMPFGVDPLQFSLGANLALSVICGFLIWRLVDARSDIKEEIGRCNADKIQAAWDADVETRELQAQAQARRTVQLASELERTRASLKITELATRQAEERADEALSVIKRAAERDNLDCGHSRPDVDDWNDFRMLDSQNRH